ncbi:MAG: hypothetical protein WA364_04775 [Candidatus Nitrosopolaris sp.]
MPFYMHAVATYGQLTKKISYFRYKRFTPRFGTNGLCSMLKQAAKILIQLLLPTPGVNNRPEDVRSIKEASKKRSFFLLLRGRKRQQTVLYLSCSSPTDGKNNVLPLKVLFPVLKSSII